MLLLMTKVYSQSVFIENGVSLSSLQNVYDQMICKYHMNVGVNYLDKKWCFLSSSLGYLRKGGQYSYLYAEEIGKESSLCHNESAKYVTLNTLFNLKYEKSNMIFYLGIGPQIGVNVGNSIISDYDKLKKINYCLKSTLGINCCLNRFLLGGSFGYIPTLGHMFETKEGNDKTFTVSLLVGYIL